MLLNEKTSTKIEAGKVSLGCAPCKGGVSQSVRVPPGDVAPARNNLIGHGGNEVAGASDVTGHFR